MGRVVKGAQYAKEAYLLRAPVAGARPEAPEPEVFEKPAASFDEPLAPQPAFDADAARAEAAKLVDDASADARRLVDEAQERAARLIDEATARIGDIESEAHAKGFEQGVGDGRAAATAEMDAMLETMRGLVEMARVERHKIITAAEPEIVRLAVALAERVINAHVDVQPNTVLEMTRSAITRLIAREMVTVRVNPADIALMREHREQLMSVNDIDNLRLIEDQRVDRGGIVIDTESGTIDAKISTQLREARRLLAVDDPLTVSPSHEPALINPPAQAS